MLFRRRARKGSSGPYLKQRYDNAVRAVAYGPVVAWRGKKLLSRPSIGHESWPFLFTDGSWADPVTGNFHNASRRGKLLVARGAEADVAAKALMSF